MFPRPSRTTILSTLAAAAAVFLLATPEAHAQSRTIVIDAGHGGHDRGGVPGQRIGEKGMTLDVAQRLRRVLQARGYRVVMTRDSDVFIPLGTRTSIANSNRGATFVSVHFNSAPRAGANGIETYYYRNDSAGLAASIHRNVVAIAPSENRGIRRRGYFVLRRTNGRGGPRGMRLPHEPDGRALRPGSELPAEARGSDRARHSTPAQHGSEATFSGAASVSAEVLPAPFPAPISLRPSRFQTQFQSPSPELTLPLGRSQQILEEQQHEQEGAILQD